MGSQLIGKTWHVSIRSQQALRTFARPADDKLKVGQPIVFGRRSSAMIMSRQTTGSRSCDCQPVGCHRAQADDEHGHNRIEIKMEFDRQAWYSPRSMQYSRATVLHCSSSSFCHSRHVLLVNLLCCATMAGAQIVAQCRADRSIKFILKLFRGLASGKRWRTLADPIEMQHAKQLTDATLRTSSAVAVTRPL